MSRRLEKKHRKRVEDDGRKLIARVSDGKPGRKNRRGWRALAKLPFEYKLTHYGMIVCAEPVRALAGKP